jgi:DNA (cytosine-5)-methyltransferase 1
MPVRAAEFFAGIGLVRESLQPLGIEVVWANDIERAKRAVYASNHEASHFRLGDVRDVKGSDLPANLQLATASFPCTDLSLAGDRAGLAGAQSGMFYEFARVLEELRDEERPQMVLLENVAGFATSHQGKDLEAALRELNSLGYSCDVFTVDARHFVAQSRVRMFIVGVRGDLPKGAHRGVPPLSDTRPDWIRRIFDRHQDLLMHYVDLPDLPDGPVDLATTVQKMEEHDARWWDDARTALFIGSLSAFQATRFKALRDAPTVTWRTAYRRTRNGVAVWELRRDAIAGCLRTTGGGSSKQVVVELGKGQVRVRWMTPLEYARLMGAGGYEVKAATDNQALFGFGDAVVVDVVRWIGEHYLLPTLRPDTALHDTYRAQDPTLIGSRGVYDFDAERR